VARVLNIITPVRNQRKAPRAGDLPGEFDFWFDGGACRLQTGVTTYALLDGTTVCYFVTPVLSVRIQYPDGRSVSVVESE
jgi:hypothetical protein